MKKLIIATAVLVLLTQTGCDDKDARDYATELVGVLKTYQVEVNKKIAAEKKSYKDLAANYAYSKQANMISRLSTSRSSGADQLTDLLMANEKFTPSDMHQLVFEHAMLEFDETRKALEEESDGQAEYIASLEALDFQAQNIAQLTKALEALSKPQGDIKKLKELAASAKEFKTKFDELECNALAEEIACLKEEQAAIEKLKDPSPEQKADKQRLGMQIKALEDLNKEQKCKTDLNKVKCPDTKG